MSTRIAVIVLEAGATAWTTLFAYGFGKKLMMMRCGTTWCRIASFTYFIIAQATISLTLSNAWRMSAVALACLLTVAVTCLYWAWRFEQRWKVAAVRETMEE